MPTLSLTLEVTDQKVRYVFLEKKSKRITIRRTGVATLNVSTAAPGALTALIKEIQQKESLKAGRLFVSINRKDTIIHQSFLPKMNKKDMEEVLHSEIDKIPSLSDREVDYIYQSFGEEKGKQRVLFAAVPQEILDYILREAKKSRLAFNHLEITPLNLISLLPGQNQTTEQAAVIIDERVSYLVIFKQGQIKYFYTTHIGKVQIYPPMLQRMDELAALSLVEELKRVVKSYILENKGSPIDRYNVVWDNEGADNLPEFLQKELKADVQPVTLDKIGNLSNESATPINPIALLSCVPAILTLDRRIPKFSLTHFFKGSQVQMQSARVLTIGVALTAGAAFFLWGMIASLEREEENLTQTTIEIETTVDQLKKSSIELFAKRDEYLAVRNQLLTQATYVKILKNMSWVEILSAVANEIPPEELALTSFKVSESGVADFSGQAFKIETIAELLRKVDRSSRLRDSKFSFLTEGKIEDFKLFNFGILANVKLNEEVTEEKKEDENTQR